jgi:hypothetical protein
MAMGGLLPSSPMKFIGLAVVILIVLALVNNVNFLGEIVKRRVA